MKKRRGLQGKKNISPPICAAGKVLDVDIDFAEDIQILYLIWFFYRFV